MSAVLYIMVRSDLASLNPGKMCAQVSHATSLFHKNMARLDYLNPRTKELYEDWEFSTNQGFGTCIVLDGKSQIEIEEVIDTLDNCIDLHYGIQSDPTYPIRDGEVTHYVNLMVSAYVFCDSDNMEARDKFAHFGLMQ